VTCLPAERSPFDQTGRTPHECSGFVASKASAAELVVTLTDLSSPSIAGIATYRGRPFDAGDNANGVLGGRCCGGATTSRPLIGCNAPQPITGRLAHHFSIWREVFSDRTGGTVLFTLQQSRHNLAVKD
jgi:hypothetical protein